MDHWLGEWWARLDRFDVVIFVHVKSHIGILVNEVADMHAKAALQEEMVEVKVVARRHVQLSFAGAGGQLTGPERVTLSVQGHVLDLLKKATVETLWPVPGELQPRELGLSKEQWDAVHALRGRRFFPADTKTYVGDMGVWVRQAPVPVAWEWWSAVVHAPALVSERRRLLQALECGRLEVDAAADVPCVAWRGALRLLRLACAGDSIVLRGGGSWWLRASVSSCCEWWRLRMWCG